LPHKIDELLMSHHPTPQLSYRQSGLLLNILIIGEGDCGGLA
jgi:hypothetical protein